MQLVSQKSTGIDPVDFFRIYHLYLYTTHHYTSQGQHMKIENTNEEVVLANVTEHGQFKIKNSAKAFGILSSGLYSNKIKAIIRELSCNAWDSHKEANKSEVQFTVHLPNSLEPWFSVRDYGLGLDHEGVTQLYTTYFESTKQNSNDFIGALGLGSKSPFSYTTNFVVTAIHSNVKRIYTAYINDHGIPAIALMDTSDTEECNGVEVNIPIENRSDFSRFAYEASQVFKWFNVLPEITGKSDLVIEKHNYEEKDLIPGVHLLSNRGTSYAVQGNIAYPINLPKDAIDENLSSILYGSSLVMHFEIGELDVAASREELSYIPLTVKSISDKITALSLSLIPLLESKISNKTTPWDQALELKLLSETALYRFAVSRLVKNQRSKLLKYSSGGITDNITLMVKEIEGRQLTLTALNRKWGSSSLSHQSALYDTKGTTQINHRYEIPIHGSFLIIVNDTNKGSVSRVNYHNKNNYAFRKKYNTVYVLDSVDKDIEERKKRINKLIKRLGSPTNVMYVSELDEKPKKQISTSSVMLAKYTATTSSYHSDRKWRWEADHGEDLNNGADRLYVALSNYSLVYQERPIDIHEFLLLASEAKLLPSGFRLFGARKSVLKDIKTNNNWKCFFTWMENEITLRLNNNLEEVIIPSVIDKRYINTSTLKHICKLNDASAYKKYILPLSSWLQNPNSDSRKEAASIAALSKLGKYFNIDINFEEIENKAKLECNRIEQLYPLLQHISSYANAEDTAIPILDYVSLIDNTTTGEE